MIEYIVKSTGDVGMLENAKHGIISLIIPILHSCYYLCRIGRRRLCYI